jgi:hypothetical protein
MYAGIIFSSSTNGQPVVIDATSSPGTLIHTFATATSAIEDVFVDATNTATTDRILTIEFGATGEAREIKATIPALTSPYRMISGARIQGGSGLTMRAYATATGALRVFGGLNRNV